MSRGVKVVISPARNIAAELKKRRAKLDQVSAQLDLIGVQGAGFFDLLGVEDGLKSEVEELERRQSIITAGLPDPGQTATTPPATDRPKASLAGRRPKNGPVRADHRSALPRSSPGYLAFRDAVEPGESVLGVLGVAARSHLATTLGAFQALRDKEAGGAETIALRQADWAAVIDLFAAVLTRIECELKVSEGLFDRIAKLEAAAENASSGISYRGVFMDGRTYRPGEYATSAGSLWHCNSATNKRPGDGSGAWTLAVKRGEAPTARSVYDRR